jgi:hypothetical protein
MKRMFSKVAHLPALAVAVLTATCGPNDERPPGSTAAPEPSARLEELPPGPEPTPVPADDDAPPTVPQDGLARPDWWWDEAVSPDALAAPVRDPVA